jgi:hypothetical protein
MSCAPQNALSMKLACNDINKIESKNAQGCTTKCNTRLKNAPKFNTKCKK